MWKRGIYIYFFFMVAVELPAQRPHTGVWLGFQQHIKLSSKWEWHNDEGYRTQDHSLQAQQFFYRTGIRYRLDQHLQAASGMALFFHRVSLSPSSKEFGFEKRIWQELEDKIFIGNAFQWTHRMRLEERFFSTVDKLPADVAFRLRYRTALLWPWGLRWEIQVIDEWMLQNKRGRPMMFDQNRLSGSLGYRFSSTSQLLVGYIGIRRPASIQHIASIVFQKNFSFIQ